MFASRRSTSVRGSLAFLLAMPLAVFSSSPLLARDDTDSPVLDDEVLVEIIVTGSRLARTGLDTPSKEPVAVARHRPFRYFNWRRDASRK